MGNSALIEKCSQMNCIKDSEICNRQDCLKSNKDNNSVFQFEEDNNIQLEGQDIVNNSYDFEAES